MRVIVFGCTGRMGKIVTALLESGYAGHTLAAAVSPSSPSGLVAGRYASLGEFQGKADCVVDFSNHAATEELLAYCRARHLAAVIATTGHTAPEKQLIAEAAKEIPVFFSANMSVGVALLVNLAKQTAKMFPDAEIEIVERHHDQKLDVPSGTALMLYHGITEVRPDAVAVVGRHENGKRTKNEIGIHALRLGSEVGTHEVIVAAGSQTITLRHEAENRSLFGEGALTAAAFLEGKAPGLYTMTDLIG